MVKVIDGYMRYLRPHTEHMLSGEPRVPSIGPDKETIPVAVVGEAPGKDEAEAGEPFVGKAGKELQKGLAKAGFYWPSVYKMNVIDRRPPSNDIKSVEAKDCLKVQESAFWDEVRWLIKEKGTKVFIPVGATAAAAFGIKGSISKVRGSVYELNADWPGIVTDADAEPCHAVVIPTFHPSYIMRVKWQKGKDDVAVWVSDLSKAKDVVDGGYNRPVENFTLNPTKDEVVGYLSKALENEDLLAVDIETAGFIPRREDVVCIGFATSDEDGLCVPFYKTGPDEAARTRYWSRSDREEIDILLDKVFTTGRLMFQNALFDVNYLQQAGYDVDPLQVEHDTLLLHHAIDAEQKHNLGFITSVYGVTPYWKEDFLKRDTTIWEMASNDLQKYNLRDCVVLHQVLDPLLGDLHELGTEAAYEENLSLIGPIIEMMQTGVKVSTYRLSKYKKGLEERGEALRAELYEKGNLPEKFNLDSDDDLRLFLFGEVAPKYKRAADYEKHKPTTKVYKEKKALYELGQTVTPLVSHSYEGRQTDSGQISVNKQGLTGLQRHLQKRISYLKGLKKPTAEHKAELEGCRVLVEWLTTYFEYSAVSKLLSTYTDLPVWGKDGRLHTHFLIHGTSTGRLSSRNPNFQNFPKKDKEFRKVFVAAEGYQIISADYNNLEFRVMAYETGEPVMLKVLEQGLNQHDENTKMLFGLTSDDPAWDKARRASKIYQFGSQYGGGDNEIYEKIMLEVPDLELSFSEFKEAKARYFMSMPYYSEWRAKTMNNAIENRQVWTAFGRCRRLYGADHQVGKQALNMPIQGGAAHIINVATVSLWKRLRGARMRARLQAQIHDQLVLEVPDDEVEEVAKMVKEEMEQVIDYRGRAVSFPVDVEVGASWGELEEVQFES